MENPHKETGLPAGLRRVKMPTDLPWSGLIAWMHRKIAEHTANSARWYHLNVAANPDPSKAKAKARPTPTTEEKRAKTAEYMRAYRKRIKDQRTKLYKELDSGALMYRTALTKWQNRVHWLKRNRRRMLRAGKWRGFPLRPDKATFLTKKAKPTR
jgi:hypothetical protein